MLDTVMTSAQNGSSYDSELKCPKCFARSSNYLNSIFAPQQQSNAVKFVYSTKCPRYLCINCKNELYRSATSQSKQLKCFSCQMFLKAQDYTEQSQEEYLFDKDLQKRQAITKIYGYNQQDSMDQLTQERVSKLLQGFKLDDLDKLGDTQNQVAAESEFLDQSQRFVEPYIYALYRTDMPRLIEQTHIPSNNTLAQIIASAGLIRKSQVQSMRANFNTDVPQNYKMKDLHKEKASKLFRSGLF